MNHNSERSCCLGIVDHIIYLYDISHENILRDFFNIEEKQPNPSKHQNLENFKPDKSYVKLGIYLLSFLVKVGSETISCFV